MKRIISLVAVVAMLFAFCVTASAATATMVVAPIELEVAEGTKDTVMNVVFNMDEETYLYGVQLEFVLPEGVTLKAVDWTELSSICPTTSNDDVKDLAAGKASFFEGGAEGTTTAVDTLTIPCTLTVDTTVEKVYDITFTGSTGILDVDTFDYINADQATSTITVKKAGPVVEDVYGDAIACAKTWTTKKDAESAYTHEFQNVAVATASCIADAKDAGFKFAKDSTTPSETAAKWSVLDADAIAGAGSLEYTAVMYGVKYNEVTTIYAVPYYTVVK